MRRDIHKMKAFVRFRKIGDGGRRALRRLVRARALHRRAQRAVLRAPLHRHALGDPDARRCVRTGTASDSPSAPGADKRDAPADDAAEELWRTYYANIFNPARLKVKAMQKEMPKKYWRNLPEAALIPG